LWGLLVLLVSIPHQVGIHSQPSRLVNKETIVMSEMRTRVARNTIFTWPFWILDLEQSLIFDISSVPTSHNKYLDNQIKNRSLLDFR
jgi:hypothetical protein